MVNSMFFHILLIGVTIWPGIFALRRLSGSSYGYAGDQTFDYVVIGGGTAGLTIATRLAAYASVAVIEAGSFYEIGNSNFSQIPIFGPFGGGKSPLQEAAGVDWGFVTTPQPGFAGESTLYPRGKCLGGSSARNYLAYQRGSKGSYDLWAELVNDTSYQFDNFLPYFQKSVQFTRPNRLRASNSTPDYDAKSIGKGNGPLSIGFPSYGQSLSTWIQLGMDQLGVPRLSGFTNGNILGQSYETLTINPQTMVRESAETSFLQKVGLQNPNLIVYPSTLATKILFSPDKVATGVQIEINGRSYTLTAKKEVILSAGALQSPQMLMISGVGPASTLAQYDITVISDLPGVGQNLWDHILGGPSYVVNLITASELRLNPQYAFQAVQDYLGTHPSGMLTSNGADYLAFEKFNMTRPTLPKNISFPSDWPDVEYLVIPAFIGNQEFLIQPDAVNNYGSISVALVAPFSRGNITISSSNAADPPIINPNWLTHPQDQLTAVAGYKRARAFWNSSAVAPIRRGPEAFPGADVQTDAQILDAIRRSFTTVSHAACTCKMGTSDDSMAVVDSKARVFGVSSLRVVDASAFAVLPPGHPVSTVYALAEKIADDILKG